MTKTKIYEKYQKSSYRPERLEKLLREVLSDLFAKQQIKDPVLMASGITITGVDISPDLRSANVFFSRLGISVPTEDEIRAMMKALRRATPYIGMMVAKSLRLFRVPRLTFSFDSDLHRGERVIHLLHTLSQDQSLIGQPAHE